MSERCDEESDKAYSARERVKHESFRDIFESDLGILICETRNPPENSVQRRKFVT
jgi:hypothetical protein